MAEIDIIFNRGVFIEMFSYAVVDEAFRATNVLLIAAVTPETVACEQQTFLLSHRR